MKIFTLSVVILGVIFSVESEKNKDCPTIKSKRQWSGLAAKNVDYQTIPVQYVIVHHTVSQECDSFAECATILQNIQNYHFSLGYSDIGYNFLIGNDGLVYEGCGWHKIGAHTYGYNRNGTGIAFIGDFTDKLPSRKALNAAKKLLHCGVTLGELGPRFKLLAARQVQGTISPGLPIYGEMQEWDNWSESP
ncbi:peptidoglycan-recognition protein SA-like [Episyrphus balteatus]|uniref:peptidoglycan-recognition protein SA-like n=1 Tax=Episyrphus balteatus TaxID=286459 RepID=UPI002485A08E|nr:peptidoglycan-recognition protein SA-like [Episyrphus balteatus]